MPIYEYQCQDCGNQFELFTKTFEIKETFCPGCQSKNIRKIFTVPLVRDKISEPSTEFSAKEEPIEYYRKKGRFDLAAREAERAGKSEWEIKRIREGKKF